MADRAFFDLSAGIQGDEMRRLLAPFHLDRFLADHWGQRPLYVEGTLDKFRGFFSRDELLATLRSSEDPHVHASDEVHFGIRAFFDRVGGSPTPMAHVTGRQAESMFGAGATICASAIHRVNDKLGAFAAAVKSQLSFPGVVRFNAYWSPDGSGLRRHFDARIATTIQIEGAKRWRYSRRPAVPWPRANGVVTDAGVPVYVADASTAADWDPIPEVRDDDFEDVVLRPGDLLVLPAGTWHECSAQGESLALNLAFEPESFTSLLSLAFEELLHGDPAWRSAPPMVPCGVNASGSEWQSYSRPRLERAKAAIETLLGDDAPLRRTWRRLVAGQYRDDQRRPRVGDGVALGRSDVLETNRLVPIASELERDAAGARQLTVWAGSDELDVDGDTEIALISRMLREKSFTAGACVGWTEGAMSWPEVSAILQSLLEAGVLVRRTYD